MPLEQSNSESLLAEMATIVERRRTFLKKQYERKGYSFIVFITAAMKVIVKHNLEHNYACVYSWNSAH